jgi:ADP-ribosylglycohydrolase
MRVSPIGWAASSLEMALAEARRSAEVTHDHPEGIKGAQAVASAVFLARSGSSKLEIRGYLERTFGYNLRRTLDEIRPAYAFDVTCQGSVPEAIIAFLEAGNFKEALRNAVSLGGDADTQASIAGAISHAFGDEIPRELEHAVRSLLPKKFHTVLDRFAAAFGV